MNRLGDAFWDRPEIIGLLGVMGMALFDLGKVEGALWPGPKKGIKQLLTGRRPDYRFLGEKSAYDGAVLEVVGRRLEHEGLIEHRQLPELHRIVALLETAHEAAQSLIAFCGWFGKYGERDRDSIVYLIDEYNRVLSPQVGAGIATYSIVFSEAAELPATVDALASVVADDEFDSIQAGLWNLSLGRV